MAEIAEDTDESMSLSSQSDESGLINEILSIRNKSNKVNYSFIHRKFN